MGNNLNGILLWNKVMRNHEKEIRNSFIFHDKYVRKADNIIHKAKRLFKPNLSSKRRMYKKGDKRNTIHTELVYVGIHVRYILRKVLQFDINEDHKVCIYIKCNNINNNF